MSINKFLDGDNIDLLTFDSEDANYLSDILNLPSVRKPMVPTTPQSADDIKNYASEEAEVFLVIWDKDQEEKTGSVELIIDDEVSRIGTIGYMVDPSHQGQNIATEAVELLTDYAFSELNIEKLKADVDEDNIGSKKVLQKNGFEKEAVLRNEKYTNGSYIDVERYTKFKQ